MEKTQNTVITILTSALVVVMFVVLFFGNKQAQETREELGAFIPSTITHSSTTVGMTDTLVYSPSNLQFFYARNLGGGNIDCTWTTTSSLVSNVEINTGLRFDDSNKASSSEPSHAITNPALLSKYMHCIGNTTTSLQTLKY